MTRPVTLEFSINPSALNPIFSRLSDAVPTPKSGCTPALRRMGYINGRVILPVKYQGMLDPLRECQSNGIGHFADQRAALLDEVQSPQELPRFHHFNATNNVLAAGGVAVRTSASFL